MAKTKRVRQLSSTLRGPAVAHTQAWRKELDSVHSLSTKALQLVREGNCQPAFMMLDMAIERGGHMMSHFDSAKSREVDVLDSTTTALMDARVAFMYKCIIGGPPRPIPSR